MVRVVKSRHRWHAITLRGSRHDKLGEMTFQGSKRHAFLWIGDKFDNGVGYCMGRQALRALARTILRTTAQKKRKVKR